MVAKDDGSGNAAAAGASANSTAWMANFIVDVLLE
jgi:hypothetical protein